MGRQCRKGAAREAERDRYVMSPVTHCLALPICFVDHGPAVVTSCRANSNNATCAGGDWLLAASSSANDPCVGPCLREAVLRCQDVGRRRRRVKPAQYSAVWNTLVAEICYSAQVRVEREQFRGLRGLGRLIVLGKTWRMLACPKVQHYWSRRYRGQPRTARVCFSRPSVS